MQLRTPRIDGRRRGVHDEVSAMRSAGKEMRLIDRVNPWFAVLAAVVTIVGFNASDLFPGKDSQRSGSKNMTEKDSRRSDGSDLFRAEANHGAANSSDPSGLVQTCVNLAQKAADDTAQGFLLSAEKLQKLRSDLHCG